MKRRTIKHALIGTLFVSSVLMCVMGAVIWVSIPKTSALERRVVAPFRGEEVSILVPDGWREVGTVEAHGYTTVEFRPVEPLQWLPELIRKNVCAPPEPDAGLSVTYSTLENKQYRGFATIVRNGVTVHHAILSDIPLGKGIFCSVSYFRTNDKEFIATYDRIISSAALVNH